MEETVELSVTVPVYNEEENVRALVAGLAAVLRPLERSFELVVVDDGSSDETVSVLRGLLDDIPELRVVELSRNFGQTLALQAALDAPALARLHMQQRERNVHLRWGQQRGQRACGAVCGLIAIGRVTARGRSHKQG